MKEITHMVNLSVGVIDPEEWTKVWEEINGVAKVLGKDRPSVSVSSHLMGETDELDTLEGETFNEGTHLKVFQALRSLPMPERVATDAINAMQNAGILFRERRTT